MVDSTEWYSRHNGAVKNNIQYLILHTLYSVFISPTTFRALGLKLLPSIIVVLCSPFDLLFIYGILILYSEEYFIGMVDKVSFAVMRLCGLKNVALLVLISFIFLNAGSTATLVSIKGFLSLTMIVGNFIDVYLFGMIAVLMN